MKSKTSRHGLKRMTALLLAVVLCIGMIPSAFAAQQDSYHDPAEHWQEANNRTNELDANAVVTIETFTCGECGKATSFEVFRTPEYTRDHSGRRAGAGRLLYGLSLDEGCLPDLRWDQHQHGRIPL